MLFPDDEARELVINPHLNLFKLYNLQSEDVENNLTRALLITLQELSPIHLRILFQRMFEHAPSASSLTSTYRLDVPAHFEFALQADNPPRGKPLTRETGLLLGVTFSGRQSLDWLMIEGDKIGARPDGWICDATNDRTIVLEVKKTDNLNVPQIRRHVDKFFGGASIDARTVFAQVSWTDIADVLETIKDLSKSSTERYLIEELIRYLDMEGRLEFRQ